jgi:hypothetical protein
VLGLLLGSLGLVATALAVTAALRLRSPVSFLLSVYLVAAAEVVGLVELLSLFDAVRPLWVLVGEAVVLGASLLVWTRVGRPLPAWPRFGLRAAARVHPLVAALGLLVVAAFVYQTALVIATPPNEWDSLVYHLSRAAAWYQGHGVEYVSNAPTERQNAFPPNAEILILYTFVFLGRDWAAGLPQIIAELALLTAAYGTARRLGFARPASLFAALLLGTLAEVALDAVVTKNNLVVASFVSAAAYFVLGRQRRELPLAAIAVALGIGTKLTAFFALPFLLLLAILVLPRRLLAEVVVAGVVAIGLFGAYGYVLNVIEEGTPFPKTEEITQHRPDVTVTGTVSSAARVYWDFLDFSGFHPPQRFENEVANAGRRIFDGLGIPANPKESTARPFRFEPNAAAAEYRSYFGPLGFLLVLPLSFGFLGAWVFRRTGRPFGLLGLALPLYVLALVVLVRYSPLLCRFMIAPVALTMPLAAWVYPRRWLAVGVAVLGALTLALCHATDFAKPVGFLGKPNIWTASRPEAQSIYDGRMKPAIARLDRLPDNARIGALLDHNDWSYLLYGPHLSRQVVYLDPKDPIVGSRLEWVVVSDPKFSLERLSLGSGNLEAKVTSLGPSGWRLIEIRR